MTREEAKQGLYEIVASNDPKYISPCEGCDNAAWNEEACVSCEKFNKYMEYFQPFAGYDDLLSKVHNALHLQHIIPIQEEQLTKWKQEREDILNQLKAESV